MTAPIRTPFAAKAIDPADGYTQTVTFHLSYDPADPYTLSIDFGDDNVWHLARELVAAGLRRRTGQGDVCVAPHGRFVVIGLTSPDGAVLVEVDRKPLAGFIRATYAAVPRGHESAHLDVDGAIDKILTGGAL